MKKERLEPGPGQESVWDYPRPPRLEPTSKRVEVHHGGEVIASTRRAVRVLETSHPPVYYLPLDDVRREYLKPSRRRSSFCEFKGQASYYDLELGGERVEAVGWTYPDPVAAFADLRDRVAFYPSKVEACYVDGERVRAQEGDFYGGWITSEVVGPFKGAPGTWGW